MLFWIKEKDNLDVTKHLSFCVLYYSVLSFFFLMLFWYVHVYKFTTLGRVSHISHVLTEIQNKFLIQVYLYSGLNNAVVPWSFTFCSIFTKNTQLYIVDRHLRSIKKIKAFKAFSVTFISFETFSPQNTVRTKLWQYFFNNFIEYDFRHPSIINTWCEIFHFSD